MPIILSNESVAISNEVYQNKDIFADKKKKLPHGYVNESRRFSCGYFPLESDIQGKQTQLARML